MKNKPVFFTRTFEKSFASLPKEIHRLFWEKLELFTQDPSHPSLRVKKVKGTDSIWEMSLTMNYRATFVVGPGEISFRQIGTHNILRNP